MTRGYQASEISQIKKDKYHMISLFTSLTNIIKGHLPQNYIIKVIKESDPLIRYKHLLELFLLNKHVKVNKPLTQNSTTGLIPLVTNWY